MINFSDKDLQQLMSKGINKEKLLDQIQVFEDGIPFVQLERPALVGEGILKFSNTDKKKLVKRFDNSKDRFKLLKFVPASGAASRMFKILFEFVESYDPDNEDIDTYISRTENNELERFKTGT